jgi:hypothetical protein
MGRLGRVPAKHYSEAQLQEAIAALAEGERFREAERLVSAAAPGLQQVLAAALASGGWFEDTHQSAVIDAASLPDGNERTTAVKTLLAEEARVTMMIGVAVGWALAGELEGNGNDKG